MTTTPKVSREKADALSLIVWHGLALMPHDRADLLSILSDYSARQDKEDKAGASAGPSPALSMGGCEGSTPSPGSISREDE